MKLAILHHHLNRGGVTQVIVNHLRSLAAALAASGERMEVALMHGGRVDGWPTEWDTVSPHLRVEHLVISDLDYDEHEANPEPRPRELASQIVAALDRAGFPLDETLLHVHNHSLGKNVSLPGAIAALADRGGRLLLQIHDFAEDFRPTNYARMKHAVAGDEAALEQYLYPQAAQIHYATLNSRDESILQAAGIERQRLHLLPNPVLDVPEIPPRDVAREQLQNAAGIDPSERLVVYPVRGIRRKNVGEMLLWSLLAPPDCRFAITLAPKNPAEQPAYKAWRSLAEELELPCVFGLGAIESLTFPTILAAADGILTTSVAEGFGMVFLEAQLNRKPLVGRDLPEITADFVEAGLTFEGLRSTVDVPTSLLEPSRIIDSIAETYRQLLADYRLSPRIESRLRASLAEFEQQLAAAETIDFAMLSFDQQQQLIRRAAEDVAARASLQEANQWMTAALTEANGTTIEQNARLVEEHFGPQVTGGRLMAMYDKLLTCEPTPVSGLPSPQVMLEQFLDVRRLRQIRNQPR